MKKIIWSVLLTIFAIVLMTGCASNSDESSAADNSGNKDGSDASEFSIDGDIEFIVPANPGGGSDINGRFLVQVIQEENLMPNNFLIVNKPGASGSVGFAYLHGYQGKATAISNINSGQLMGTVVNDAEYTLEDFTPLATLAIDSYILVVKNDSEYTSFDQLVEASKNKQINVAVTGTGSEGHLFTFMMNKHANADFNLVSFQSGGEQATALLGGHVDASVQKPNEIRSLLESGEVRLLASSAKERLEAPFDAPTFTELGYSEIQLQMFRGFMGPPDMSAEAIAYWEDILKKVSESEQWKEGYLEPNSLQWTFMGAEESREYWEKDLETYLQLAEEVGVYTP